MIDYVHLSAFFPIPEAALNRELWRWHTLKNGAPVIYHHYRGVWIRYYPRRSEMSISGKLITLLHDTQVSNLDDIYGSRIDSFVSQINEYLSQLSSELLPDVRSFDTKRIDYCFNIRTPYVQEYLNIMTTGFSLTNCGNRINYTQQKNLSGSTYIKTKADFKDNCRRNYVLNYYDKYNRLEYQKKRRTTIPLADWALAENILRLEVQCGFQFIKELCKKLSISRLFGDMLSYKAAFHAEALIYERVFKADITQDYYTYQAAKKRLLNPTARKTLELAAEFHRITASKYNQGRMHIKAANIYPFAFLPKGSHPERLDNPLKLIRTKLIELGVWEECA